MKNTSLHQTESMHLEPRVGCIAAAVDIVGAKWTLLLIKELAEGPKRFCEFERAIEGLNPRTLSQRLENLEVHGIISKQSFNEMPPRTDYRLTDKGRDFIPILEAMAAWGNKHLK